MIYMPTQKRGIYIPNSCFATDIDETLIPGEQLMDEQIRERIDNSLNMSERVKTICKHSTAEYLEELKKKRKSLNAYKDVLQNNGEIYTAEFREVKKEIAYLDNYLFPEHYKSKDIVREELEPEFEGLITYSTIYVPENMYPGVIEALWAIYNSGVYDFLAGNSQTNNLNEEVAKDFLKGVLPPIETHYVRFHKLPGRNEDGTINVKREPSDKWQTFIETHPNINVSRSSSVENSPTAHESARRLGFNATLIEEERCLPDSKAPAYAIPRRQEG